MGEMLLHSLFEWSAPRPLQQSGGTVSLVRSSSGGRRRQGP